MKRWLSIGGILFVGLVLALLWPGQVWAEADAPTPQATERVGTVTGRIVNGTPGGVVPDTLDLMLHAWDANGVEQVMLHATSDLDGTFKFEDVPFNASWVYAVMATYDDVAYFSSPVGLSTDQDVLEVEVPIYESTNDTSQVRIERLHVFFDVGPMGLTVAEVYILSNQGDRTVKNVVPLGEDTWGTLAFPLPRGISSVRIGDNSERFVRTADGFVDTAPLLPGRAVSQILVSYVQPYEDGMTYRQVVPYPVAGISVLVPEDLGLTIRGDGLVSAGVRTTSDGEAIAIFTREALEAGETLEVTLSGTPNIRMGNEVGAMGEQPSPESRLREVIIGGLALGLALIGVGVWWYRREDEEREVALAAEEPLDFETVVARIAALDEAHARGDIADEVYRREREALRQLARALLVENTG